MLENLGQHSQSAAKKLNVKSALNPMLWLTAISTPICLGGAYLLRDYPNIFVIIVLVGLLPITITCIGFIYFAIFKTEKLQSEDYQIRHESLQLLQQKSGEIDIRTTSLAQIVNPAVETLDSKGKQS